MSNVFALPSKQSMNKTMHVFSPASVTRSTHTSFSSTSSQFNIIIFGLGWGGDVIVGDDCGAGDGSIILVPACNILEKNNDDSSSSSARESKSSERDLLLVVLLSPLFADAVFVLVTASASAKAESALLLSSLSSPSLKISQNKRNLIFFS